jgi:hypothetical protein
MGINRHRPHVLVLPEDDADRQLANGFFNDSSISPQARPLPYPGGWMKVLDRFEYDEIPYMRKYSEAFMVLVFDFDDDPDRLSVAKQRIPADLADRVFIVGSLRDPESLRKAGLGKPEEIGLALAKDCREGTDTIWRHDLLRHNAPELARLRKQVSPILFPPPFL